MAEHRLVLHHVGGRWADHPLPIPPRFADDFVSVLYEADDDAIPTMREAAAAGDRRLIVVPACLAEADRDATLHLYANPGLTSLRPLGPLLRDRYRLLCGFDFDHGADVARVVETRPVRCTTLDGLVASSSPPIPPPDFLTLDVQGMEYEVLAGAREQLHRSVCGVIAEVEFGEMYRGQKRFQDIHDLLAGLGFEFVRFLTIGENGGPRQPLGFRGTGYQVWADALFLRRLDAIPPDPDAGRNLLTRLCFFAIVFGNVELASACAERLPAAEPHASPSGAWEDFVAALARLRASSRELWPPAFSQILPPHRIRDFSMTRGAGDWPRVLEGLRALGDDYRAAVEAMRHEADSEFEALLRGYGFADLADRVNALRREQAAAIIHAVAAAKQHL